MLIPFLMFALGFINPGMTQSHLRCLSSTNRCRGLSASSGIMDTTLSEAPHVVKQTCFSYPPSGGYFFPLVPLHTSGYRGVGCACSPRSLTYVSSRGFTRLPPSCNPNYFGEPLHIWATDGLAARASHSLMRHFLHYCRAIGRYSGIKKAARRPLIRRTVYASWLFFSVSSRPSRRISAASSGWFSLSSVSASQA